MEKATGGKVKVNIYAADQLTNGNQSEGIQALMNGDPVQISMHSNLIYSAFDPRFNVVSLPFIYDSYDDADAKFDGEAGEKLKEILGEYGLHCMGIAENGFRELTNSKHEVKTVDDMKNLKVRVAGSNLLMECYKRWGADATNMNWSETYTALQQNTVEGEENPLPAIDAASVQEVQPYCSMWDAIYDCLFFCINQDIYDSLTPEQQQVVDEAGQKAVEYERYINRSGDEEIMSRWEKSNGVTFTKKEDMDIDSFKKAVDGIDDWFVNELKSAGYDDAQDLVDLFTEDSVDTVEDYSDLNWPETTWNFACSTTETSTWADGGRKFGELMEKATGGKVKVNIYAADQLTNGNQSEGIQALMNGDPVQISMHSNLIYSAFDPRFNVVSLPFIYDSYDDADAKFDGEAGDKLKEILNGYGLHCMGIAENGFRELTNSKHEVKSVDDMKNLKVRVAGSNLLMECYKRWGADATNMNWSETYTALQQNTVEGEENPLPAIDAASVQEVQPYCSMWDAIYDCLFFCINQDVYDALTPEQQAVVDECGQKAVEYERYINRSSDDEIKARWADKNGVTFTEKADMDIDSFKEAVDGVDEWFVQELKDQGYDDGQDLVDLFTK
jgi:C4-dicarboxylate transporter DctM subunit